MFTLTQVLLVIVWFTLYNLITSGTGLGLVAGGVVLNGLVTGAIMGNMEIGFYLGGTYELMNIGLNPLGGSTVPNYNMGVVVGVAFGAVSDIETGMAVGIVVATLASTLDVLAKMVGSYFLHGAQKAVKEHKFDSMQNWINIGLYPRIILDATLPLILLFAFGSPLIELINNFIPAWLLSGFKNAGNMLPAIGFAILLRSMNLKGNIQYLIIGFAIYAYFGIGALGAAVIGIALALMAYQNNRKVEELQSTGNFGGVGDE